MKAIAGIVAFLLAAAMGTSTPAGAAGPVVGPPHVVGQSRPSVSGGPLAAFDGTNTLVIWTKGPPGSSDVVGTRVAPDGTVLDPDGLSLATGPERQVASDVVFDGTNFLVVWSNVGLDASQVEVARVSRAGTKLDATPTVLGPGSGARAAAAESSTLVVWRESDNDTDPAILRVRYARVGHNGDALDPAPGRTLVAREDEELFFGFHATVASNGVGFLVGYAPIIDFHERPTLVKIRADGQPGASTTPDRFGDRLTLASDGTGYLAVWSRCMEDVACEFGGDRDVFVQPVASDLTLGTESVMASGPTAQDFPSVAWNAGRYLVAYRRQEVTYQFGDPTNTGPVDVRASLAARDGSQIAGGKIIERDVVGSKDVAASTGDDFGVFYEGKPSSGLADVTVRTVSPK